jgi:hypothetical protein
LRMTTTRFNLSPWAPDHTAVLEAWGPDRQSALQAGLDAALTLMLGEDVQAPGASGPMVPLRGEGDTMAALFSDLMDDLLEQIAVHGPIQAAALDGVLRRDRDGFVAWGYLSPRERTTPLPAFEQAGEVEALMESSAEIRLRASLRRIG